MSVASSEDVSRDVEEILLLKTVQSPFEIQPKVEVAPAQVSAPFAFVRPDPRSEVK
jgi:hypothetical protein